VATSVRDTSRTGKRRANRNSVLTLTLAVLAALAVLDVLPREQLTSYGRRILLLALIVVLASAGISGLVHWGRRGR
jgi:hypothetical protein